MSALSRWDRYALDWPLLGAPLRPCAADVRVFEEAVARAPGRRALLLGVTPEIAAMRWPRGTELLAIDGSAGMIRHVWPGGSAAWSAVVRGDWHRLPLAPGSRDIVIGDSPVHQPPYPAEHRALLDVVSRVLAPGGVLVLRCFCRPERAEAPAQVFGELRAGRIGSFHAFKWRLAMALQRDPAEGVTWDAIWTAWNAEVPEPGTLLRRLGWAPEVLRTIEVNRGSQGRITFPTVAEIERVVAERFTSETVLLDYELGERCPIVIARPRLRGDD